MAPLVLSEQSDCTLNTVHMYPKTAICKQYLVTTLGGKTVCIDVASKAECAQNKRPFVCEVFRRALRLDGYDTEVCDADICKIAYLKQEGRVLDSRCSVDSIGDTTPWLSLHLRVVGGMTDRQNRVGSKFGGGGVSSTQNTERDRKERLRQLALESVDLAKDPYLMRNHLGTYECKLCLTLHTNEGNYLAHTQGKKHQAGLAKRAAMEKTMNNNNNMMLPLSNMSRGRQIQPPRVKIGRPGYQVSKSRHPETNQRCLSFQLTFPQLEDTDNSIQPRHRFMSAYEQRVDSPPDRNFQYLLVACYPYETIAFKVPNHAIDKSEGKFVTNWDATEKKFNLTFYFIDPSTTDIPNN